MEEILELTMVICSGLSWPLSVHKSAKLRTARGKSLFLEVSIWIGYISVAIGKIVIQGLTCILHLHIFNIVVVPADICLCFRNRHLDALADRRT